MKLGGFGDRQGGPPMAQRPWPLARSSPCALSLSSQGRDQASSHPQLAVLGVQLWERALPQNPGARASRGEMRPGGSAVGGSVSWGDALSSPAQAPAEGLGRHRRRCPQSGRGLQVESPFHLPTCIRTGVGPSALSPATSQSAQSKPAGAGAPCIL